MAGSQPLKTPKILLVDDDLLVLDVLKFALKNLDREVEIHSAPNIAIMKRLLREVPDFWVAVVDQFLPDGEGIEQLRRMKMDFPNTVRILITGSMDRQVAVDAINRGEIYRFLAKPMSNSDLLMAVNQALEHYALIIENQRLQKSLKVQNDELKTLNDRLELMLSQEMSENQELVQESTHWRSAYQGMVDVALSILQKMDPALYDHSRQVSRLAKAIGTQLGYGASFCHEVELAGLLHDLGLLGVESHVQGRQRRRDLLSSPQELELLKEHPHRSASLVRFIHEEAVIKAIEQHHELINGEGYPGGLAGDDVTLHARVLAVADAVYELLRPPEYALAELRGPLAAQYDARVVAAAQSVLQSIPAEVVEKSLALLEIQPGMKLLETVFDSDGVLVLKPGVFFDDSLITRLKEHDKIHPIRHNLHVEIQPPVRFPE